MARCNQQVGSAIQLWCSVVSCDKGASAPSEIQGRASFEGQLSLCNPLLMLQAIACHSCGFCTCVKIHDNDQHILVVQDEVVQAAEVGAARKVFDLSLTELGPYSLDFTRSGRYLALAGRKGHLALMDWQRGKLITEIQVPRCINFMPRHVATSNVCTVASTAFYHACQGW